MTAGVSSFRIGLGLLILVSQRTKQIGAAEVGAGAQAAARADIPQADDLVAVFLKITAGKGEAAVRTEGGRVDRSRMSQ